MSDEIITLRGQRYVVDQCGSCGVLFVVPEKVYDNHRDHGGYSHCSNGHTWGWRDGRIQRDELRQERDRLKQQVAQRDDEIAVLGLQIAATRGELTKARKRAKAGTCPCCKRTFRNMAEHMKTKHPGFDPSATDAPKLTVVK